MKAGRFATRWAGAVGILLGLGSCVGPQKPPSPIETLLSGLMDVRYRATLVYARGQDDSHPLAVVLDPQGGAKLSILELSSLEFDMEDLGGFNRRDLIVRLERMEGQSFGGQSLHYLKRFSKWRLRRIMRYGAAIGYLMSVDPHLRFEIRAGTSGQVFSLMLLPSANFQDEVEGEL